MAFGSFEAGVLQRTPIPDMSGELGKELELATLEIVKQSQNKDSVPNQVAYSVGPPSFSFPEPR